MKNSKNKFIAGIVCGLVVGSVGTSFVGNFQGSSQQVSLNTQSTQNNTDSSQGTASSDSQMPSFAQGERPQMPEGMNVQRGSKGEHHQGQGSLETTDSVDVANGQYSDGTYEGNASGYAQGLTVQVKIASGKISNIEITSHNETPGFYENAFETVPAEIIQKQSTDVDTVSGATYSSVGIINAVNDALSQATTQTENSTTNNSNLETQAQ